MAGYFSSDFGATAAGVINSPASMAQDRFGNAWQRAKNVASKPYNYVARQARNVRNVLEMGPLNNIALERAFNKAGRELGAGPKSRALARMAGRRSLYSRVFSGPSHQTAMNWGVRDMLGMGQGGVAGSGFNAMGKIAEPTFSEFVEQGTSRGLSKGAARRSAAWGVAKRIPFKAIGPAFVAYSAVEGYKKEGAWGAVKGGTGALAESYLFTRAFSALGAPVLGTLGALTAASALEKFMYDPMAYGSARGWARPWTSEYHKKTKGVQMGGEIVDPHGINATMRQRSLLAIQNSRLNARSGLGQEAQLTHTGTYFS